MKTQYYIFGLVLLALVTIGLVSCTKEQPTQAISYLTDTTEEGFVPIATENIRGISLLPGNADAGERIRIQAITELAHNPIYELGIDSEEIPLFGNEYERQREVEGYFLQLDETLQQLRGQQRERPGSVIFANMARELNYLEQSNADKKVLLLNSDLMENSRFNFYHQSTFYRLERLDSTLTEEFLKDYPLPNLNGITVHLIYQAKGITDSRRFEVTSRWYARLLTEAGAEVYIGANLVADN